MAPQNSTSGWPRLARFGAYWCALAQEVHWDEALDDRTSSGTATTVGSKPPNGASREPSKLGEIQPDHWIAEYTTDLIELLNALGLLIELEPEQAALLEEIIGGELLKVTDLKEPGALIDPIYPNASQSDKPRKWFSRVESLWQSKHVEQARRLTSSSSARMRWMWSLRMAKAWNW